MVFNIIYSAIDIPTNNHFYHAMAQLKNIAQSKNHLTIPDLEDIFVIDLVKNSGNLLNNKMVFPNDVLLIPLCKKHHYQFHDKAESNTHSKDMFFNVLYSITSVTQVMNVIFQNHRDLLENKESSLIHTFDLNVECLRNQPELTASIIHFEKNANAYIENKDELSFDLNKLKILFETMISIFGQNKLSSVFSEEKSIRNEVIQRVYASVEYIQDHFVTNIRLADLARIANLSTSYYTTVFTQIMKQSPQSFLINVRIKRAKELIESTSLPIEAIALNVGINNQSAFYRSFKQIIGISPNAYRKLHSNKYFH